MAAISPIPTSDNCTDRRRCLHEDGTIDPTRHEGERCEPLAFWNSTGCPRLRAVDPRLTLLEVRRGSTGSPAESRSSPSSRPIPPSCCRTRPCTAATSPGSPCARRAQVDHKRRRTRRRLLQRRRRGRHNAARSRATCRRRGASPTSGPRASKPRSPTGIPDEEITIAAATTDAASYRPDKHGNAPQRCSFDQPEPTLTLARNPQFGVAGIGGAEDDRTILSGISAGARTSAARRPTARARSSPAST